MAKFSTNNIAHAIYAATKDKEGKDLDVVIKNTAQMLKNKHLLSRSPDILKKLEEIIDKENGIVKAEVHSKEKLSKKMTEEVGELIRKRYKAKEIMIYHTEDKKLLGGIRIQVGEEIIDLTLKNKLKQLQDYLIAH